MSSGYSKELNVQNVRYFMNFQVVRSRKISFQYERLCTKTRFEIEAKESRK